MSEHVITLEDRIVTMDVGSTDATDASRYRWKCSCGRAGGWKRRRHDVKTGYLGHTRAHGIVPVIGAPTQVGSGAG